MADKSSKLTLNIDGKFYVDDQCIACDACVIEAPLFFAMNDEESTAYVFLQPKSAEETNQCIEAMILCPVNAIGDDGNT